MPDSYSNDDRPTRVSSSPGNTPNSLPRPEVGGPSSGDERATRVSSGSGFGSVSGGSSGFGGFSEPTEMGERKTMVRSVASEIKQVAWLYCRKGLREGQLYQFRKKRNELGRASDCDVFIEDGYAGGHHGAVVLDEDEWKLFDFASTNGTKVNGKRLGTEAPNPTVLNDGDVIEIGDTELTFKCL
jgi:hypothetical protein